MVCSLQLSSLLLLTCVSGLTFSPVSRVASVAAPRNAFGAPTKERTAEKTGRYDVGSQSRAARTCE